MFKQFFHSLSHYFIQRQLVWEMVDGGGACFGIGCVKCGEIEWIDYYRGLELKRNNEAIHTDEFYKLVEELKNGI